MAGGTPQELPRCRPRRHPRPLLPRQRRRVDRRGRPRPDPRLRGQLLHVPGDQEGTSHDRGQQGRQARQDAGEGARLGPLQRQGAPGEVQGAPGALRGARRRGRAGPQDRHERDQHPCRSAPGRRRAGRRGAEQVLRRASAVAGHLLHAATRRHRRCRRSQRRRQDDAVPDDHRRRAARRGRPRRRPDGQDLLRRPDAREPRHHQERVGGRLRGTGLHQGRQLRDELTRVRRVVRFQGVGPAEEGERPVRW